MFRLRYEVRTFNRKGELVTKKRFTAKDKAINFVKDSIVHRRKVALTKSRFFQLTTFSRGSWGGVTRDWIKTSAVATIFCHHSVTKQLAASATVEQEKEQMRILDAIAVGRGFNGVSYCWAIFPSGRCYEGRGWMIQEAATEGFNTSSDSIVFVGNTDAHKPTEAQRRAFIELVNKAQREGKVQKTVDVRGHREVSGTACPGQFVTPAILQHFKTRINTT